MNVSDSVENNKTAAWFMDQRSIMLAIQKQPGTNTVEVARAVRELLPTFEKQLPASVSMHIVFDRSESIRDSVNDVKVTLLITLTLVVLVIFLFLRNLSATAIPSLAMPMSIVGTFAIMFALGYSLDNLSLMALTLSVGFVVDDAIVMLENIVRHVEGGMRPFEAALKGSREIGFTIVSITFSLIAVFIPVLLMGGMVGRVFREFAVTIAELRRSIRRTSVFLPTRVLKYCRSLWWTGIRLGSAEHRVLSPDSSIRIFLPTERVF